MNPAKFVPPELREFRNFLWLAWRALGLPNPTPIQYEIAEFLQDGKRRKVICAFRGIGKSYICVAYVIWRLLLNPDLAVLVVSASKDRADDFTTFAFQLMQVMPVCRHLLPKEGQRESKISFDVAPAAPKGSPSVRSRGIMSQITGSRADIILADDVSASNNSETPLMREKVSTRTKEFSAILKPGGETIYLGTYQSEEDLLLELPDRGYTTRVWPARIPMKDWVPLYGDRLAPSVIQKIKQGAKEWEPTDPDRFDEEDLQEREIEWGRAGFLLQFMLLPHLSDEDRYPLKLRHLIVSELDREMAYEKWVYAAEPDNAYGNELPNVGFNADRYYRPMAKVGEMSKYQGICMAIDPSGRGQDETGYAVVAFLNSQLFVLAAGGLQGGYDDAVLMRLATIAADYRVNQIIVEENFGQGMFKSLLMPKLIDAGWPTSIEVIRHSKQKEHRMADVLEPIISQHRMVVAREVVEKDWKSIQQYPPDTRLARSLFYQMSRLTREKGALRFDDRLDALAMACGYWADLMSVHRERKIEAENERRKDAALKRFMEHALRNKWNSKKPSWIDDGR